MTITPGAIHSFIGCLESEAGWCNEKARNGKTGCCLGLSRTGYFSSDSEESLDQMIPRVSFKSHLAE